MIADSRSMKELLVLAERLALTMLPVLVLGETGTGKTALAQWMHERSSRARGPFIAVNCAAIPEALAESELFGHARGAFTGAVNPHKGAFERAHGGTLFLDEIGELAPSTQAKLLTALDSGTIQPVGASAPRAVDVRVIAATNRDLAAMVEAGTFREDLKARLSTTATTLTLSPLRERPEDLDSLARATAKRCGWPLSVAVLAVLKRHTWPGNIRELVRTVEALAALRLNTPGEVERWLSNTANPPAKTATRAAAADLSKHDSITVAIPDARNPSPPANQPPASSTSTASLTPALAKILEAVKAYGPVDAVTLRAKTGTKSKALQSHLVILRERGFIDRRQDPKHKTRFLYAVATPRAVPTTATPTPPASTSADQSHPRAPSVLPASSSAPTPSTSPVPTPPTPALPALAWLNAPSHSDDTAAAREAALFLVNYAVRHLLAPTNGGLIQ